MTGASFRPFLTLVTARQRVAPAARTTADEVAALVRFVAEAAAAGVPLVQVRENDLEARALTHLVREVLSAVQGTFCRVVVNDRADVAAAAGAHGVHLQSRGVPIARLRDLGAGPWLVGRSSHSAEEVSACRGADYVIFGTVFETASKPGVVPAGVTRLTAAVRAAPAPVLAIGGITSERLALCAGAGACGVAGISWLLPPSCGGVGPARAVSAARAAFHAD